MGRFLSVGANMRFLQNIIYLTMMAAMVVFGAAVYYYRMHGIENGVTTAGWMIGLAMAPVSFFIKSE